MVLCLLTDFIPLIFVLVTSDRLQRKFFQLTINPWISTFLIIRNIIFMLFSENYNFDPDSTGQEFPIIKMNLFNYLVIMVLVLSIISYFVLNYFFFVYYFAYRTSRGFKKMSKLKKIERRPFIQVIVVMLLIVITFTLVLLTYDNLENFDFFYLILSIGFPIVYILSSACFPSFKSYFHWWYQGPLLCQFLFIQIIATLGYKNPKNIKISFHTSNLLINVSWWLLLVSIVLLQRYRRPFFFIPKELSPNCFVYETDIKTESLFDPNCCYCLGSLTEPNWNDEKYKDYLNTKLTKCMKKPCGKYAHEYCLRLYLERRPAVV